MRVVRIILSLMFWPFFLTACMYLWVIKSSDFMDEKEIVLLLVAFSIGVVISIQKVRGR